MGRFIPRHRLKAGALALPYAPAASVGRSVTSRGTPDGQDRRTGRVRRSALPSPVAAVTAHRVALSEVPLIAPSTQNARAGIAAVEGQVRRRSPTVAMTCKTLAVRAPFAKMGFIATDALTHRLA